MRPRFALISIIAGGAAVILWMVLGYISPGDTYLGIDAIYPGLVVSILIYLLDRSLR